jgi:segregation and condensation protein A
MDDLNNVTFKLEKFEGPMDLLLHLIDKEKISIYDIPVAQLTEQYMNYLHSMEEMDMEITSEFLVMAAYLIKLKSRMLLPKQKDEQGDEIDPRAELVERLIEYKMCKYVSEELREKHDEASLVLFKGSTLPPEVENYEEKVDVSKLLEGLTLPKLHDVFISLMKRTEERIDPVRSKFGEIKKEEINLSDKMIELQKFALTKRKFSFIEYVSKHPTKLNIIVSFLGVLELMKMGRMKVVQKDVFDDFDIEFLADDIVMADNTVVDA